MRTWNTLAAFAGAILCVLALLVLGGCTSIQTGHPISTNVFGALFGMALGVGTVCLLGGWRDGGRPALVMLCVAAMLFIGGCAALPMPFQPHTQDDSNTAEGAFLVLATVDTLQTVQIAKHPKCYHEADPLARALYGTSHPSVGKVVGINLVMITAHTMVASWLDDKVADENARYDAEDKYGVGPWYGARFVFHVVSLVAEGSATLNNYNRGIHLTSTGCPE